MTDRVPPASPPAVSVVIPAYNRAATICAAMESVLRQTYADFELLIVDDCSSDGTLDAAARLSDPRIRLIKSPENAGASAARNRGVHEARGKWIAFQDSDDEWLPRKLEKQMARLTAPGADHVAAYCGMMVIGTHEDVDGSRSGRPQIGYVPDPNAEVIEGDLIPTLITTSLVSTQTLVVRRDVMLEIGGFDEEIRALIDWECMLRLAQVGSVACVDEPLVLQWFSPNSITRDIPKRIASWWRAIGKHGDLMRRHPRHLARLYYIIAGEERRAGNYAAARAALRKALALQPARPRFWAMLGYAGLRGAFAAMKPAGR